MTELLVGTGNPKKANEIQELLPSDLITVVTLADVADAIEVAETGETFEENARLKSTEQSKHLKRWVLAEDSGISAEALNGEPGVYSARFSGSDATDERNNDLLLRRLDEMPNANRIAYYSCHLSLADPSGTERLKGSARCYGRIISQRRGENGFGYDPLFEIAEYHLTFGQLGPAAKKAISHRARALREFIPRLLSLLKSENEI